MKITPMGKSVCILAREREELCILCNFLTIIVNNHSDCSCSLWYQQAN